MQVVRFSMEVKIDGKKLYVEVSYLLAAKETNSGA